MRKGDLKKQEFIRTAEARFCRYGYSKTSVQDILDELHSSKGSFYHHFVSKEALLGEICAKRAAASSETLMKTLDPEADPVTNLNLTITGMIPLSGEKMTFLLMLLPVFSLPEGLYVRHAYCDALSEAFYPLICREIARGNESGVFYGTDVNFQTETILLLLNHMWGKVCDLIIRNEGENKDTDPAEILAELDPCRKMLEKILEAPYGSLTVMNLPEIQNMIQQIHRNWG